MKSKKKEKILTEKDIVLSRKWTIELITYNDGSTAMKRSNERLSIVELLGICEYVKLELLDQIKGDIKPDIVERKFIK